MAQLFYLFRLFLNVLAAMVVIAVIYVLIVKLATLNVIQITNNYLAPSHAYPSPAWQLPLLLSNAHDQLYTSLHS